MNILFTSVGRRGYLVEYFKQIEDCRVFVANSQRTHVFDIADGSVITPLIYDDGYIDFLLNYCINNNIDAVVSLFDVDLMVLAKNKKKFEDNNIKIIVSDENVISVCNDKWDTYGFLTDNGFNAPKTYLTLQNVKADIEKGLISYPLVIKPRWGMGSIGVFIAEDERELEVFYNKVRRTVLDSYLIYEARNDFENCVIIQEMLNGEEYGLDIINDLNGNFQNTIIKKKIAMRSGETDIAVIEENDDIRNMSIKLSEKLGHIANLDCDVFLVKNIPFVLEMNARFGGGYPFGHIAGVNLPAAIVKWLKSEKIEPELLEAKTGVRAYKNIEIVVENP